VTGETFGEAAVVDAPAGELEGFGTDGLLGADGWLVTPEPLAGAIARTAPAVVPLAWAETGQRDEAWPLLHAEASHLSRLWSELWPAQRPPVRSRKDSLPPVPRSASQYTWPESTGVARTRTVSQRLRAGNLSDPVASRVLGPSPAFV
jgi:hypothetical protein